MKNYVVCKLEEENQSVRIQRLSDGSNSKEMHSLIVIDSRRQETVVLPKVVSANVTNDQLLPIITGLIIARYQPMFPWISKASFYFAPDTDCREIVWCITNAIIAFFMCTSAFALTETVDGIEWSYYKKNGYAVLEHPDTRK